MSIWDGLGDTARHVGNAALSAAPGFGQAYSAGLLARQAQNSGVPGLKQAGDFAGGLLSKTPASNAYGLSGMVNPQAPQGQGQTNDPQAAYGSLLSRIQGLQNPHTQGLKPQLTQARATVTRNFAGAERGLTAGLASRGMLGSGAEVSGLASLAGRRAGALSGAENGLQVRANEQGAQWEMNRIGAEQGLLNTIHGRQDAANALDQQTLGTLIASAPGVYKMLDESGLLKLIMSSATAAASGGTGMTAGGSGGAGLGLQ